MATTQQMREGEAELNRIVRWVTRRTERAGAEAMAAAPSLHPDISRYCGTTRGIMSNLARFPGGTRRRGAQHGNIQTALNNARSSVDSVDGMVRSRLQLYSRYDLDILLGCFSGVEQAFRNAGSRAPGSLGVMRNAVGQRIATLRAAGRP